jgi:hypothetical protein
LVLQRRNQPIQYVTSVFALAFGDSRSVDASRADRWATVFHHTDGITNLRQHRRGWLCSAGDRVLVGLKHDVQRGLSVPGDGSAVKTPREVVEQASQAVCIVLVAP